MKRYSLLIAVSMLIVFLGCWYVYQHKSLSIKPKLHAHPKYFLLAHGHIAPSLLDAVALRWTAIYASNNPKCQYYKSPGAKSAGVYSLRQVVTTWKSRANNKGDYQLSIPLDKYLPGYCQWSILGVYVRVNAGGRWFVASFNQQARNSQTSLSNEYTCSPGQQGNLLCENTSGYHVFQGDVNPNKSYDIQLNVRSASLRKEII